MLMIKFNNNTYKLKTKLGTEVVYVYKILSNLI